MSSVPYGNLGVYVKADINTPYVFDDIGFTPIDIQFNVGGKDRNPIYKEGSAVIRFDNSGGDFTPTNTASPLYGKLKPNLKISIETDTQVLWTGYIRRIAFTGTKSKPFAEFTCEQGVYTLREKWINWQVLYDVTAQEIIEALVNTAGWTAPATSNIFILNSSILAEYYLDEAPPETGNSFYALPSTTDAYILQIKVNTWDLTYPNGTSLGVAHFDANDTAFLTIFPKHPTPYLQFDTYEGGSYTSELDYVEFKNGDLITFAVEAYTGADILGEVWITDANGVLKFNKIYTRIFKRDQVYWTNKNGVDIEYYKAFPKDEFEPYLNGGAAEIYRLFAGLSGNPSDEVIFNGGGSGNYAVVSPIWGEDKRLSDALTELAQAEQGSLFIDEAGYLNWQSFLAPLTDSVARSINLDTETQGAVFEYGRRLVNAVKSHYYQNRLDTDVQLYSSDDVEMSPRETLELTADLSRVEGDEEYIVTEITSFLFTGSSAIDYVVLNSNVHSATIRLTNNSDFKSNFTFIIKGSRIVKIAGQIVEMDNADSIVFNRHRAEIILNHPIVDTRIKAEQIGAYLIGRFAYPFLEVTSFTINARSVSDLASLTIGKVINLTSSANSMPTKKHLITGYSWQLKEGAIHAKYDCVSLADWAIFILDTDELNDLEKVMA